ncbi:hypothetical protein ACLOJK_009289 [Asimina triloba]
MTASQGDKASKPSSYEFGPLPRKVITESTGYINERILLETRVALGGCILRGGGDLEMGISQKDGKMEGWLYVIRSNRIGLQFSQKRYFVLEGNSLDCFRSAPLSKNEVLCMFLVRLACALWRCRSDPIRSAVIDSCIRVTDNGREGIHRKVFFIFTLYNASNHDDRLKLGARSSEEAAKWIHSFKEASSETGLFAHLPTTIKQHLMLLHLLPGQYLVVKMVCFCGVFTLKLSLTNKIKLLKPEIMAGLRLFKETKDGDFHGKQWDDHPATMAVGVVDATSEDIFQTVMSLGPSRSEGMRKRDLLLRRYWRREDDGTYGGGYVITPVNQGRQSVVKHMLAIDWKFWKSYLFTSSARSITIRMLGRVAALREFFKAKLGNCPGSNFSSGELMNEVRFPQTTDEDIKVEVQSHTENGMADDFTESEVEKSLSKPASLSGSFLQFSDAADEFFDVPEESEYDEPETSWSEAQDTRQPKWATASVFVKKLHDLAVQKRGYMDLQEAAREDSTFCSYGTTLPKDPTCTLLCSWTVTDPSTFLIRGDNYLQDQQKNSNFKAKGTLMQMVAADWLKSDKREDDLAGRPESIVQKYAAHGGNEFFFIVNIQVPGSTTYSLALYYMMNTPLESVPLLNNFVNGDDAFRNARFKLIPYISKGSWIVKQSVGKKACLVGQALEINYFHGKNYLELGVDIGSSTVARGVVSLVLGYLNNLVIEMAFLIQGNSREELPEFLLGTCRLNHLDASKAILVRP